MSFASSRRSSAAAAGGGLAPLKKPAASSAAAASNSPTASAAATASKEGEIQKPISKKDDNSLKPSEGKRSLEWLSTMISHRKQKRKVSRRRCYVCSFCLKTLFLFLFP